MANSDKNPLLWNMNGTTYDLKDFVTEHPGGELAIQLAQGEKDSTTTKLFENYHAVGERHNRILETYRVGGDPTNSLASASGFRTDLEKMLRNHFGLYCTSGKKARRAYKATWTHAIFVAIVFIMYFMALIGWLRGSLTAMLLLPVAGWLITCNVAHDASHFTFSESQLLNSVLAHSATPLFWNAITWYHQHVVSHHTSTNEVENDVDLQHFAPMKLSPHDTLATFGSHTMIDYLKVMAVGLHLSFVCPSFAHGLFPDKDYHKMFKPAVTIPVGMQRSVWYRAQNLVGPASTVVFLALPLYLRHTIADKLMFR
jgi:cytochrome b involved in lipid metabolism